MIEFAITRDIMRIALAPFEGPKVVTVATFHKARLNSVWVSDDEDDDFELPWDLIGFDCYALFAGRWRFVLNCGVIEWCFESTWPIVKRSDA